MKTFEAKWRGRCGACDETIHPGDDVGYEDDLLVHEGCSTNPPRAVTSKKSPFTKPKTTPPNICPVCSMDHAGECM